GDVGGVGGDLVGDAALLHILFLGQAQVLLGRDVAEHGGPVVRRGGGADAAGDVVVAGEDVGDQRPEDVERRPVADAALELHVELDLVEGDVAGSFVHDLHAFLPGAFGELADGEQLGELEVVGGVGEPAGPAAVADAERDVVFAHHVADL